MREDEGFISEHLFIRGGGTNFRYESNGIVHLPNEQLYSAVSDNFPNGQ